MNGGGAATTQVIRWTPGWRPDDEAADAAGVGDT